jgi:Uma2 family endonuclease
VSITKLMTADDLLRLPDDGFRYELIAGEPHRMPPAGGEHGETGQETAGWLWTFVRAGRLGKVYGADTGFVLREDPDTVVAPDAAFVRAERLPSPDARRGYLRLAPDLAVEIVSPHDRPADVEAKTRLYLDVGVPLVWVLRPNERTVTVHAAGQEPRRLGTTETLDGGNVLPGFRIAVAELFG